MATPNVDEIWADFNLDGTVKEPNKADVRRWGRYLEAIGTAMGMETYPNKAAMDADLTQEDGQPALLWSDPTPANNFPTVWVFNDSLNQWIAGVDRIEPIRLQQVIDGLRLTDLENDSLPVDFDDENQFNIINTTVSNPTTRYNWSVVGDDLVINQTAAILLLIGFLTNYTGIENRSFSCVYTATDTQSSSGFGICFNPSSGSLIDATNHVSIIWRNNGLVVAYRQDGATVVAGLTAPGAGSGTVIDDTVPRVTWGDDDVLSMTLVLDADGTTGTFTTFKNGDLAATFRVPGLPVGYIGAVGRNTIATTMTIPKPLVSKIQQAPKRIYIDPNVGASSIGTEANPFKTISDGLLYVNESGRRLDMVLKEGIYAVGADVQTNRYDRISIVGDHGKRPIIRPGTMLTSGWGLVGDSAKVYARSHVFAGTTGSTTGSGGFLDITNSDGDWGFAFYTRVNPLLSAAAGKAALEALATGVGGYFVSAVTGTAYIKAIGDVDPNTLEIFRSEWPAGLNLMPAPARQVGMTEIYIAGIDFEMPYANGILAGRVRGLIEDCFVKGAAVNNAFATNMMTGEIASCRGWRCYNDGINHTVTADFADPNPAPRVAQLRVIDCEMTDMAIGDGLSNHASMDVSIIGGTFARNGKCGIVPVANATIVGAKVFGNATEGIGALATNFPGAQSVLVSVRDCHLWDNGVGFSAVAPDVSAGGGQNTATIEILGGSCTDSTAALFRLRNDATVGGTTTNPCQIRAKNLARSGNTVYRNDVTGAHSQVGYLTDVAIPITPGAF